MIPTATKRLQFKALKVDADQGIFEGYASAFGIVDYERDVVEPGAFKTTLASGSARDGVKILAQHDPNRPIGKSLELREDDNGLFVKGFISATDEGKNHRQLVKDGVLCELSIGYDAIKSYTDANGIRHLTEIDLGEISIVTFPANPEAKIQGYKSKGGNPVNEEAGGVSLEDIAKTIQTAVTNGFSEAIKAIAGAEGEEGGEQKNEGGAEGEEKPQGEEDGSKTEDKPKNAEKNLETKARSEYNEARKNIQRLYAGGIMPHTGSDEQKSKLPPGIGWVRYQKCMWKSHGDPDRAAFHAKKMYNDAQLEKEIKALSATSPSDGGYLVPEVYASDVIPLLYAQSIIKKLGATTVPMPNGNLRLPRMGSGSTASYTGELRDIKSSQPGFEQITLSAKKLTVLVPISNDLLRSNSYAADQIILKDSVQCMALEMDRAGLMGKGTDMEPKGLLNMKDIPRIKIDGMPDEKTTGRMLGVLIRNNVDMTKLGWAISGTVWEAFYNVVNSMGLYIYREQMDKGQLNGHQFGLSTQLPTDTSANHKTPVILGDWSEFLIGEQLQMESEMFREGTITDDKGITLSAVRNDITILRIISTHDFGVRHEKSFVIGEDVHTVKV